MTFSRTHCLNLQLFFRLLVFLLLSVCMQCSEKADIFGFSAGIYPVHYNDSFKTRLLKTGRWLQKSEECAACHPVIYQNWRQSRHRVAFTNQLYKEAHSREPLAWCVNCHAPFLQEKGDEYNLAHRVQAGDGISCVVCHVREQRIMVSRKPNTRGKPAHPYLVEPAMATESFCASCHQFNFPVHSTMSQKSRVAYSDLVMQDTVHEYLRSSYQGRLQCINCHLQGGTSESHRFPGGHDLELLRKTLHVRARRISASRLAVRVFALGIGHSFPTGDLFRSLRLYISDPGNKEQAEIILHKRYENIRAEMRQPGGPAKYLAEDTTIAPPPAGEYTAMREFVVTFSYPGQARYSLYIDYLSGFNHATTRLSPGQVSPLIKKGRLERY